MMTYLMSLFQIISSRFSLIVQVYSVFFFFKVWLAMADNHLEKINIDWDKTLKFAFNERSNPDDDTLGMQIVKVTFLTFDRLLYAKCIHRIYKK